MIFDVLHTTDYRYDEPASEAYVEARLTPPTLSHQKILRHELRFSPTSETSSYTDYFDNEVTFYSLARRHRHLKITNRLRVETSPRKLPELGMDLPIAEARQVLTSKLTDIFDYTMQSERISVSTESKKWALRYLSDQTPLRTGLEALNTAIHKHFRYDPGSTDNATPLAKVWKQRSGVCQDFAQIFLSILRTAGLPARYICGYIEAVAPDSEKKAQLVGSVATHAWVEVLTPSQIWVALDPTNNCWCDEQHVTIAYGRDYREAAPVRGTFKTSGAQHLRVAVKMKRRKAK
ncbi:MAG: transglutaminase domain-containing protein [Chthoniobacterales bacterium]